MLWVKRVGGVFDEEFFDFNIDSENNIWIMGYVVGVFMVVDGFFI